MEILVTKHVPERGEFHLVRELPAEDGGTQLNLMVIPEDAMEWRCAEYQIEPTDVDLLMDIILYEGFIPQDGTTPPLLLSASSIKAAQEEHVGRIIAVKQAIRPVANAWKTDQQRKARMLQAGVDLADWEPHMTPDALLNLREKHIMHPEVLVEKAALVAHHREVFARRMAGADRAAAKPTGSERAKVYRAMRTGDFTLSEEMK